MVMIDGDNWGSKAHHICLHNLNFNTTSEGKKFETVVELELPDFDPTVLNI